MCPYWRHTRELSYRKRKTVVICERAPLHARQPYHADLASGAQLASDRFCDLIFIGENYFQTSKFELLSQNLNLHSAHINVKTPAATTKPPTIR